VLSNYPEANRVYIVGRPQQRFNWPEAVRQTTSANSAMPYRDELFGPEFTTSVFMSEPANNVVHREVLEPDGVTFTSHRAKGEESSEFLASADNWFRPTMLKVGPDGALYIADMYRLVIEHPEYFPEELKHRPDLRAGDDKGRIWRVYSEGTTLRKIPRLDQLDAAQLVAALESPNGWQRDAAQRLLVQSGDKSEMVIKQLQALITTSRNPKTCVQALATCEGLSVLSVELIKTALANDNAAVRELAVRLSESFSTKSSIGELADRLTQMADDPSLRVRYQLAFTLGEWHDARAGRALSQLARRDWNNAQMRVAIMSSAVPHIGELISAILVERGATVPPPSLAEELVALATQMKNENPLANALNQITAKTGDTYADWQLGGLVGFLDALDRRGMSLSQFSTSAGIGLNNSLELLDPLFAQARRAADPQTASRRPESETLLAIRLLGRETSNREADFTALAALLSAQVPTAIQQAALKSLKRASGAGVGEIFLANWRGYAPAMRQEALNILFSRPAWVQPLLSGVETGKISPGELGLAYQQKLLSHAQPEIRERATKLFSQTDKDRRRILQDFDAVKSMPGDATKGAEIFRQQCATCHRLKGEGNSVGPDLTTVADKSISALLVAILDPNQAVEARYVNYNAVTKSERELSGIIAVETPNSVTLRTAGGTEETLLRADIKELTASGVSLMPEGFEKVLKPQDLSDLFSYILSR